MFVCFYYFLFIDTAPTEFYTLSLHDALPIFQVIYADGNQPASNLGWAQEAALDIEWSHAMAPKAKIVLDIKGRLLRPADRKSTRLNSSHGYISYAVFCLKKKKQKKIQKYSDT